MENNTLEVEKAMAQLHCSFDMYEKTKKQTEKRMKQALLPDGTKKYSQVDIDKEIALIDDAEKDVIEQFVLLGGKEEDLKKKTRKKSSDINIETSNIVDMVRDMESVNKDKLSQDIEDVKSNLEQKYIPQKGEYDPTAAFDVIPLPSKGEGYKDKISKMSVAFLTAYDENMIVSPNLYRDNLILDYLLQEKVLSKGIDPMDLLEGDRDAILLFLRATGYGNEYPITVTDDVTGREFDAIVDLSKLNYKDFNLKGDSNGWFTFVLPVSKKEIKFRFPTHRDTVVLDQLKKNEDTNSKKEIISRYVEILDAFVESDNATKNDDKVKVRQAIRTIENWGDEMDEENDLKYNHTITNRLNLLIMAVDGITERSYINDFIKRMSVRDSMELRKFITKNEPGIDFNITVQKPESLGGGSLSTFLQLDQFLFLNIPE